MRWVISRNRFHAPHPAIDMDSFDTKAIHFAAVDHRSHDICRYGEVGHDRPSHYVAKP